MVFQRLRAELELSTDGFRSGIQDAQQDMDSLSDRMQSTGRSMQKAGAGLTAGVTAPLALMGRSALNAAADAEELGDRSDAIFGEMSDDVEQWAETTAEEMGRSRRQMLDHASTMQDLIDPTGEATEETMDLSMGMAELAQDVSSFQNMDPDRVMGKFQSAMAGQSRAVRDLGVDMSAAAVEAELMEMGIEGGTEAATDAQEAQARYNILVEETQAAHGDAVRTQDTFTGSMRQLRGQVANLAEQFGQHLIPAATRVAEVVNGLIDSFDGLSNRQQQVVVAVAALAAALGPLILGIGTILTLIPAMVAGLGTLSAVSLPVTGSILLIGAAVAALVGIFATDFMGIRTIVMDVTGAIMDALRPVISILRDRFTEAIETLQQRWETFVNIVGPLLEGLFSWFSGIYDEYVAPVEADFIQTAEVWQGAIMGFVEWIRPYLQQFFDWYVGTIQDNLETLQQFWDDHGDSIMAIIRPLFETIEFIVRSAMDALMTAVRVGLAVIRGDWEGAWSLMTEFLERHIDRFADYGRSMMETLAEGIRAAASAPIDAVEGVVDGVRDRLPSSDAEEGPLSDLTASGESFSETFADGIEEGDLDRTVETELEGVDDYEPRAGGGVSGSGQQQKNETLEALLTELKAVKTTLEGPQNLEITDGTIETDEGHIIEIVDGRIDRRARKADTRMG